MIDALTSFALTRRFVIVVATLILVGVGINALFRVPIEAYPDVGETQVLVITQWPGHAAEEVERLLSMPIERAMNTAPKQSAIRSVSIAGLSVVTTTFADGTNDYFARQQVLERLGPIPLPDGVSPSLGPLASPIGEIMRYRLVNCAERRVEECADEDNKAAPYSLSQLKDMQEWVIERELFRVDGVADVSSFGGTSFEYQVRIDPTLLVARGLSLRDVELALQASNLTGGGGVVRLGPEALNVRTLGLLAPNEIADVAIANHNGTPIRVRDVAKVELGYQPRLGRVSVDDDPDVVAATVVMRRGQDASVVLRSLHEAVREVNRTILPKGVKIHPYYDRSRLMSLTQHTVIENLTVGLLLVTLVLFVFLGSVRAAAIVAVTIPLSLLVAFIGMDAIDLPANLLSIGAVDFGLIVDGAIVMVENIFRLVSKRNEEGREFDFLGTIREAAQQVARPTTFAKLIVVTSYLPIFSLQSVEGRLFRPMAFTVGFALLGALVVSVTLVPVLASHFLPKNLHEKPNFIVNLLRKLYVPFLKKALSRPRWVFAAAGALLVANVALLVTIGSEFLPHLNEGALWVRASMPGNISFEEAQRTVDGYEADGVKTRGIRARLRDFPEVQTMAVQLGRPDGGTDPTGFYNAEFLLVLRDRSEWRPEFGGDREKLEDAMSRSLQAIPGVTFGFSQPISDNVEEALTGVKGQLAVKIVGNDLNALDDLASSFAREIADVPGVRDLGVIREIGQSNLHIDILRERAERVGVTVADVQDAIEAGLAGLHVTDIVDNERLHPVVVRYQEGARDRVDAIRRLPIAIPDQHTVPLSEVADVQVRSGASRIFREEGRRYIALKFSVRGRDLGSTIAEAQAKVKAHVRVPPDYKVSWGGEFESAQRAGRRLAIVVPITLFALFCLLMAMFKRVREGLLIMGNVLLTAPLGGLLALHLTQTNFSVSAGVGFLALFGVSISTCIILVATANVLRAKGVPMEEALINAADTRLRPMLMTALVATLGLVPAAVSSGIGSDSQKPLAIVVVGGLISSLAISLYTLPLLYRWFVPEPPPLSHEDDEGIAQ
jgi:heavy metal efflux system protein